MKRLFVCFFSLLVFVSSLFCFAPDVYASDGASKFSSLGYSIPAFPSDVKDYDYLTIRYWSGAKCYELLCSKGPRPFFEHSYVLGGYTYRSVCYPAGSTIIAYRWYPLKSDAWDLHWGPTVYSSAPFHAISNLSEELFLTSVCYCNFNMYDADSKIFFVKTPLMNFTIMQLSISAFLQKISLPLITIIIPSCLVLLGVSVISLVLLPKLFKVFLKI